MEGVPAVITLGLDRFIGARLCEGGDVGAGGLQPLECCI